MTILSVRLFRYRVIAYNECSQLLEIIISYQDPFHHKSLQTQYDEANDLVEKVLGPTAWYTLAAKYSTFEKPGYIGQEDAVNCIKLSDEA